MLHTLFPEGGALCHPPMSLSVVTANIPVTLHCEALIHAEGYD